MKPHKRTLTAIAALWFIGLLLSFFFAWNGLDESFDLWALFNLRGARSAPSEVVVVGLDQATLDRSGQNIATPRDWPRRQHARLIKHLHQQGAKVIAFDFEFHQWRGDEDDQQLAAALREAGNVVLVAGLEQRVQEDGAVSRRLAETLRTLPVAFQQSAAGVAPFTLPRRPPRVNGYDSFRASAGDLPALPVTAFHLFTRDEHALLRTWVEAELAVTELKRSAGPVAREWSAGEWRKAFVEHPSFAARVRTKLAHAEGLRLDERQRRVLHALVDLYAGDAYRYLQFYGPPGTVKSIPYARALASKDGDIDWRGKAVFVGWLRDQEKDVYYTPFSSDEGDDLSGVEIAAHAFANLLDDKPVRPVQAWQQVLLLLAFAVVLGVVATQLPSVWVAPVLALLALGYGWFALHQFDIAGRWWPILVPLIILTPLAIGLAWWRRTRELRRLANALSRVMENRLPRDVAQRMARSLSPNLRTQTPEQWLMHGTCLHTDVAGYTRIAHGLRPDELHRVMQNYFRELEQIVKQHGGFIVDFAGDSMLALWTSANPDPAQRVAACRAALAIARATGAIDPDKQHPALPTRIGLDAGQIALGFIDSDARREFRAFGDIVNTSQRVEEKNKSLRTWVLATEAVLEGIGDILTRPVGDFQLRGRDIETRVHELISEQKFAREEQVHLAASFALAMQSYRSGDIATARERFSQVLREHPQDGPTLYYLEQVWERSS